MIYRACEEAGYILSTTADHGNAEQMVNKETRNPHTAHTTNPVPFIMTGDPKKYSFAEDKEGDEPGTWYDVAPTILALLVSRSITDVVIDTDLNCALLQGLDQLGNMSLAIHCIYWCLRQTSPAAYCS